MNHAALSMGSPIHLVQPFVFPMPSSLLSSSDTPIELSPALGKGTQNEEVGSDWSLDQFPLPFPSPDLTPEDQPASSGESAFATGTSLSSGYTKRQRVTDTNDATASPAQPSSSKNNNQQMRTRHQIAAAWWRGITAKRIAKTTSPTEQDAKSPPPVPLSPVASPTLQPPLTLVHSLSLASGTNEQSQPSLSLSQSQVLPLLSTAEQTDIKAQIPQITVKSPFQMAPQFSYPPQLSSDLQPIFFHPFQYMYAPMIPAFRSSIDIFGGKNESSANWGTTKMGALTNSDNNIPNPPESPSCTACLSHSAPSCPTSHVPYPTFASAPYSLAMPPFEYSAPSTHNTYYITNVNNSTFCANNPYPYPTPIPTATPTPTPTPPPPMPSPFTPPPPSTPTTESTNNGCHTTNYNFTYNATYNCYDSNVTVNENFENKSVDASVEECETAQGDAQTEEARDEVENEMEEMEEEAEEEEEVKNDSDSDYEEDGEGEGEEHRKRHSHRINILVNTGASRPPVVSVRATMNTRKRNAESATIIETTQTVHTEVRSHSRKNKRDPESPSSPSKELPSETKDKSKGWKWHEYNAQEPKKRRTTSTYSFTSSPCPKI